MDHPPSAPPPDSYMTEPLLDSSPSLHHFRQFPWSTSLLNSPDYYPINTWSRLFKQHTGEDGFFADTLATASTIPHCLTLRRRSLIPPAEQPPQWPAPTASPSSPPSLNPPDVMMLLSLNTPGVCGHPSTAHGGVIATLLDETMSLAVALHAASPGPDPRGQIFTAQLDVRYRQPVQVPGLIVVKARVVARQGRKFWVRAQVLQEDDQSSSGHLEWVKKRSVMTDAMAFWLETVPKL